MSNPFTAAADRAESPELARRIRIEGRMAVALVDACLDRSFAVSVFDGEEIVVDRSTDAATIVGAMFSTDDDQILIYSSTDAKEFPDRVGWFRLIYGNDGTDVVSDYLANEICDSIWNEVLTPLADGIDSGKIKIS